MSAQSARLWTYTPDVYAASSVPPLLTACTPHTAPDGAGDVALQEDGQTKHEVS